MSDSYTVTVLLGSLLPRARQELLWLAQAHPARVRMVDGAGCPTELARQISRVRPGVLILSIEQLLALPQPAGTTTGPVLLASEAALTGGSLRAATRLGVYGCLPTLPADSCHLEEWRCTVLRKLCAGQPELPLTQAVAPVGRRALALPRGIVVIGASTGGTQAVEQVVAGLPATLPYAVVVAVHLPAQFARSFAARLSRATTLPVIAGQADTPLASGQVVVVPGGQNSVVRTGFAGGWPCWQLAATTESSPCADTPSIDLLMRSAAEVAGRNVLGVVLTGLGSDGTCGAQAIRQRGGRVAAQDRASAAVFSMPEAAIRAGHVNDVVALPELAQYIARATAQVPGPRRFLPTSSPRLTAR